jgi:hypothetical protein
MTQKATYLILLILFLSAAQAASYLETVGPWTVQFNCSENLSFQKEHNPPSEDGSSIDALYMLDGAGHQVGWFAFFSYAMLMKAGEENFDNILNAYLKSFKVTSPVKSSIDVDGTAGRMAEGYASDFSRKWRGAAWAYRPFFDSFTNTNMTRSYVALNCLLEQKDFEEIVGSAHVTYANATA